MDFTKFIRDIPDFPAPGILFRDITPLLAHPEAFSEVIDELAIAVSGYQIDKVAGIESRGFIFGTPLALKLGVGFVPIRKPGKLPADTIREEYTLEYGTNAIEMHSDALEPGDRVLIVDDLLATGGTACAAAKLIERGGGKVAALAFVIELTFLEGRKKLEGYEIVDLVTY
ncbi:MAG TPA: adenine phosphoribosyltransferase [Firmicutes bacterium]|nr:adenine phosphoribosyltransferase [Bacillota bacterium]